MSNIDNYKARLGYGVRTNLFRIEITLPTAITNVAADINLLCHKVNFPKPRDVTPIEIDYLGEKFKVAGEKGTYEDITIEWREPSDFAVRNAIEEWLRFIQKENRNDGDGTRSAPGDYKSSSFKIYMLGKYLKPVKGVLVRGAFPLSLTSYSLDMTSTDLVTDTAVFAIDNYDPIKL